MEMLFYNPEYLAPLNTGYRKVDGNGFLEGYDKENIRTVLESQAVKIDEYRNIISMGFNTPAMFKVVKELAPGSKPEITILSLFPKNNYNNNFGRPFDLGVVIIPYSKVVEMEQEQTSRLYAPWISNQIAVTDGRGIEYSSYAIRCRTPQSLIFPIEESDSQSLFFALLFQTCSLLIFQGCG